MKEHISLGGKEKSVRALCRGPGKTSFSVTFCHYHTHFTLTSPWLPEVICASLFILPRALSGLCLSDIIP